MEKVRAKFTVSSTEESMYSNSDGQKTFLKTIKLSPVTGNSQENKDFFKWTPSGKIELGILNETAAKFFEIGKEYYIDFTPSA